MGEALGFPVVKSGSKKSEVGEHFEKVKKGLTETKNKLNELLGKISETKNADGSAVKVVDGVIKEASANFEKLISVLTNLAGVTKDSAKIGDNDHTNAVGAHKPSVETIIKEVQAIIETATKSGVNVEPGNGGEKVANSSNKAGEALAKSGGGANANAGSHLADEVAKADSWAMINKIKDAQLGTGLVGSDVNEAGALATEINGTASNTGAKTTADIAAAVALKAMTKDGKFSALQAEVGAVKSAAASAVNKVLGVLDEIISRTVASELSKVGKAVNGVQYSENTAEKNEGSTTK